MVGGKDNESDGKNHRIFRALKAAVIEVECEDGGFGTSW